MKQKMKFLVVLCCMMLLTSQATKAQCRDLDTKELAEMLNTEKKAGVQNDSLFTAYFNTCGLQYGQLPNGHREMGFRKKYTLNGKSYTMTVSFRPIDSDKGENHRLIRITTGEHGTWWWMILRLQAFGMNMKEGQGDFHDLKGKGLFAGTGSNSLTIGY